MTLPARRSLSKGFLLTGLLCAAPVVGALGDPHPLLFASSESKTLNGDPVYNEITWQWNLGYDEWTMRQSHQGLDAQGWDHISIVVNKVSRQSSFYQLAPGGSWTSKEDHLPYKIACFTCHSNGPRAIRPDTTLLPLSSWDQWRVFVWNLRIKTYGLVQASPEQNIRYQSAFANQRLQVPTCQRCHQEDGWFARGPLTRQNHGTIRFMMENGHMPPPGFDLPEAERKRILKFIGDG